jgi:type IV pilus assembly protein PilB
VAYTRERLGELLITEGLITREILDDVLQIQAQQGGKVGEVLVRELILTEEQIAAALAGQKGFEHVNLAAYSVDRAAVSMIPERFARSRWVLPIAFEESGRLVLAMADPLDVEAMDDVEVMTSRVVIPVVAGRAQIELAIDKYIASADAFQEVVDSVADSEEESEELSTEDVPVVRLVNQIIREAVHDLASDIHIEPQQKNVRVRYRVDGVLQEIMVLPNAAKAGVISRLKIMGELDIAERRRPQDGRIALRVDERPVDLRIATLPTPHGESIVIRILNSELTFHSLNDIGLSDDHIEQIRVMLARPYGSIMISGPTGSGKSTTLYAALRELNEETRKIITVEDPIEYQMAGLTQMAANTRIGLTFASGLRTILRSDPDIVMVGEIRDPETAEIAVRAALTGHLVLSSIHTNDAPSALTRLVDMAVPPYITSSALVGVVAQRLVRKLCPECRVPLSLSKETLLAAGFTAETAESVKVYGPGGCDACHSSGYRGRIGLFEIMPMDDELTRAFLAQSPSEELREIALSNGMRSLRDDALDKVAAGITGLEEVNRVVS